jgi:hypothetical protein
MMIRSNRIIMDHRLVDVVIMRMRMDVSVVVLDDGALLGSFLDIVRRHVSGVCEDVAVAVAATTSQWSFQIEAGRESE